MVDIVWWIYIRWLIKNGWVTLPRTTAGSVDCNTRGVCQSGFGVSLSWSTCWLARTGPSSSGCSQSGINWVSMSRCQFQRMLAYSFISENLSLWECLVLVLRVLLLFSQCTDISIFFGFVWWKSMNLLIVDSTSSSQDVSHLTQLLLFLSSPPKWCCFCYITLQLVGNSHHLVVPCPDTMHSWTQHTLQLQQSIVFVSGPCAPAPPFYSLPWTTITHQYPLVEYLFFCRALINYTIW